MQGTLYPDVIESVSIKGPSAVIKTHHNVGGLPEKMGLKHQVNPNPIALQVDDVAAARALLESRGVAFHGDTLDTGVCHMALFSDPDGNALMLHHRYAPRHTDV